MTETRPFDDSDLKAFEDGEVELRELLGLDPDYLDQLRGRAQWYLDGGHDDRALIMLEMLEALDRKDKLPALHAVDVLLRLGRSTEARAKVEALLERDPDDADALVALAEVRIAAGELAPAAELLERVVRNDPDGRTLAGARARVVASRAHERIVKG